MNRKPDEWLELIARGKSATLELMSKMPAGDVVAKTLAAFSNTEGGVIVFGVSERGDIVGLQDNEANRTIIKLESIASGLFAWACDFGSVDINGKRLAFIEVGRAPDHLLPVTISTGTIYMRRGASNFKVDPSAPAVRPAREGDAAGRSSEQPRAERAERTLTVFLAMAFGKDKNSHLEDYYQAMKRVVDNSGHAMRLVRADSLKGNFEISQRVMDEIDKAAIIITDFTCESRNVYFEAGFAKGRNKLVIQTALEGTNLEFDIRNWRTIVYTNATNLEEQLAPELEAAYAQVTRDGERGPNGEGRR